MKQSTKILQGIPPLIKVFTDTLTEGNNRDVASGSCTELFFILLFWSKWYKFHYLKETIRMLKGVPPLSPFFGFYGQQY